MAVRPKRKIVKLIYGCVIVIFFVAALQLWPTIAYVHKTYFAAVSFKPNGKHLKRVAQIPQRIHQIYFNVNNDDHMDKYKFAQQSWLKRNPDFTYTLWNESMVDHLVKTHYPQLYQLYLSYPSWMNQIDFGKYVVIHRHGGIYADLDMECVGNISSLLKEAYEKKREVVLRLGLFTLATNNFIAATPQHPFLDHVISGLLDANRWYVFPHFNIMLTSGATYFQGRYRNYHYKEDILTLPDVNKYVVHYEASSWHKWDSKVLMWFQRRGYVSKPMLLVIPLVLLRLYIIHRRRKRTP